MIIRGEKIVEQRRHEKIFLRLLLQSHSPSNVNNSLTQSIDRLVYLKSNLTCVPSVLLLNVRSIAAPDKFDDLTLSCSSFHPYFCVVTETWLNASHDNALFYILNYSIQRKDRIGKIVGDVAIWVRNSINCSVLHTSDFPTFIKYLCLSFKFGSKNYLLFLIYYTPNTGSI